MTPERSAPEHAAPVVVDSVTQLDAGHRGTVAIAASHGGDYTAAVAMTIGLRGFVCNDASVGWGGAGIRVLGLLEEVGLAAATIDHRTGRIGDGRDCSRNGILSYVNTIATRLGCRVGDRAARAARLMAASEPSKPLLVELQEARFPLEIAGATGPVWGIDSASLADAADRGAVLVTGSHGALLGDRPETALKADARAALFNDAGAGPDGRGRTRLPVLDERGIAAVTVSASSAAIGSARSTYENGVISFMNGRAAAYGAEIGMPASAFVAMLARGGVS